MIITLKKALEKDFRDIAELYKEEYSKPPFNEPWTSKKSRQKIGVFSKYCDIWKINSEGKFIGFIIINPNQWCPGEVAFGEEMAVKKDYQRNGVATEVFKQIFDIYRKKGFKNYLGIVNKTSKSWGLHKKVGAIVSGENFIMEKKLK